jgi:hypothetical protein
MTLLQARKKATRYNCDECGAPLMDPALRETGLCLTCLPKRVVTRGYLYRGALVYVTGDGQATIFRGVQPVQFLDEMEARGFVDACLAAQWAVVEGPVANYSVRELAHELDQQISDCFSQLQDSTVGG